jgi:hypothetical protein
MSQGRIRWQCSILDQDDQESTAADEAAGTIETELTWGRPQRTSWGWQRTSRSDIGWHEGVKLKQWLLTSGDREE